MTKEGVVMRLHEMTTSHIQNCIRLLERNIRDADYAMHPYGGDSDAAMLAADAWDRNLQEYILQANQNISTFKAELRRRA